MLENTSFFPAFTAGLLPCLQPMIFFVAVEKKKQSSVLSCSAFRIS